MRPARTLCRVATLPQKRILAARAAILRASWTRTLPLVLPRGTTPLYHTQIPYAPEWPGWPAGCVQAGPCVG